MVAPESWFQGLPATVSRIALTRITSVLSPPTSQPESRAVRHSKQQFRRQWQRWCRSRRRRKWSWPAPPRNCPDGARRPIHKTAPYPVQSRVLHSLTPEPLPRQLSRREFPSPQESCAARGFPASVEEPPRRTRQAAPICGGLSSAPPLPQPPPLRLFR